MQKPSPCQRAFHFLGCCFFIFASCYFAMLLWKSYVWYKWLDAMEKNLIRQTPPTSDPLINPRGRFGVTQKEYKKHWEL